MSSSLSLRKEMRIKWNKVPDTMINNFLTLFCGRFEQCGVTSVDTHRVTCNFCVQFVFFCVKHKNLRAKIKMVIFILLSLLLLTELQWDQIRNSFSCLHRLSTLMQFHMFSYRYFSLRYSYFRPFSYSLCSFSDAQRSIEPFGVFFSLRAV